MHKNTHCFKISGSIVLLPLGVIHFELWFRESCVVHMPSILLELPLAAGINIHNIYHSLEIIWVISARESAKSQGMIKMRRLCCFILQFGWFFFIREYIVILYWYFLEYLEMLWNILNILHVIKCYIKTAPGSHRQQTTLALWAKRAVTKQHKNTREQMSAFY